MKMCKQKISLSWLCVVPLLLALLFSAHTAWGQETNEPAPTLSLPSSGTNTPPTGPIPTDPWSNFDSAWTNLKDELTQSAEDSEKLSNLLHQLQTETNGLRSSLAQSIQQYEDSEKARMIERSAAEAKITDAILKGIKAEKSRDRWKTATVIVSTIAGILGVSLAMTIASH